MKYRDGVVAWLFLATMIVSSCNTTKYIGDSEKLLTAAKIKILGDNKSSTKLALELELDPYIEQKPNSNWFFVPREYIYFKNSPPKEKEKSFRKYRRDKLGEPPVLLDSSLVASSIYNMQNHLRQNKGYYESTVTSTIKVDQKKAKVVYNVTLNDRFKIKSINYFSDDTAVLNTIIALKDRAVVKAGDYIDASNLELEKNRITNDLQDLGYAEFIPQFIDIKGDSSKADKSVELFFEIFRPSSNELHKKYRNGDVNIYTDYYNKQDTFSLFSENIDSKRFLRESSDWVVDPAQLNQLIFIEKGKQSSRTERSRTFKKLSGLSAYKFAAINAYPNPLDSTEIEYDVLLTPQNFKWVGDFGFETYYSTGAQFRNLFGFSLNGKLLNRNFLRGSEQYSLTGDISTELSFDNKNFGGNNKFVQARTFNAGIQNTIEYPRILKYTQLSKLFKNIGIISEDLYNGFQQDATSNVNTGLRFQNFLNYFQVKSAKASLGYKYSDGLRHSVSLDQFGITLNDVSQGALFDSLCVRSPIYCLNLQDNLFSGLLFNNLFYVYNRTNLPGKINYSAVVNIETSGLEIFGLNKLFNGLSGNDKTWRLFNGQFEFSKFVKVELDNKFNKRLSRENSLAWRFDIGALVPYGDSKVTPFIRQFSAGGPNSLRGWLPRQLVGGLVDNNSQNLLPLYQGDIKLEANTELRFDLFSFFEGALFLDAGNVWQITSVSEPDAKFTKNFYKQVAVAAGWGLRMDFSYFIIRLDFGYKVRNPFPDPENGSYWYNWAGVRRQGIGNPQVGINYPF